MREERVGILNGSLMGSRPEKHLGSRAPDHSLTHKEVLGEVLGEPFQSPSQERGAMERHRLWAQLESLLVMLAWSQDMGTAVGVELCELGVGEWFLLGLRMLPRARS